MVRARFGGSNKGRGICINGFGVVGYKFGR